MATTRSVPVLKREIIRLYNEINQDMYAVGVRQQRVELLGDKILVLAEHQRVPALAALDCQNRSLTRMVDAALLDEYKARLRSRVEALLGMPIRAILKDYDPVTQLAGTIICLDGQLPCE